MYEVNDQVGFKAYANVLVQLSTGEGLVSSEHQYVNNLPLPYPWLISVLTPPAPLSNSHAWHNTYIAPQFNMLRVRPVPVRHAMVCGCVVIVCTVSVCFATSVFMRPSPPSLVYSLATPQVANQKLMMHESCKVTHKQIHLSNLKYAEAKTNTRTL